MCVRYSSFRQTFVVIFHIVLSVPICIIAVNDAPVFESEKKVSVHHKTTPHGSRGVNKGLLKRNDALV